MKHGKLKNRIAALICSLAVAVPTVSGTIPSAVNQLSTNAAVVTDYINFDNVNYYYHSYCSPLNLYVQYGENTCWAYVLRALTMYKYSYYPSNAELLNIANNYTNSTGIAAFGSAQNPVSEIDYPINADAYRYIVKNYFSNATLLSHPVQHLSNTTIASYVNADKPIIMLCSDSYGGGHILLLMGYFATSTSGSGMAYIEVYDPYDGATRLVSVPSSGNIYYTAQNGHTFVWNKSIIY